MMKDLTIGCSYTLRGLLALLLCSGTLHAGAEMIPPQMIQGMDDDILAGRRPTFALVKQENIFFLRQNVPHNVDLVVLRFKPEELSTAQMTTVTDWAKSKGNAIYLQDEDIHTYAPLFGLKTDNRTGLLEGGRIFDPVNLHCQRVTFGSMVQNFQRYFYFLNLPPEAKRIVEDFQGHAVCGSFPFGERTVFFCNTMQGVDQGHCTLNFWHWVLGLPVPDKAGPPPEAAPDAKPENKP